MPTPTALMPPESKPRRQRAPLPRAFSHRVGVRLEGAHITCDAESSASDVIFLSHAQALGARGRRRNRAPRGGRQELLVTEATLALLGRTGERLRRFALPASFGRPFVLGDVRVELASAGHLPGSASLLVEVEGRRTLYAGTIRREAPGLGAAPCELRAASAVCIDATFGSPRFVFPPPEEALARVRAFVDESRATGRTPVLLTPPFSTALEVAAALAREGTAVRAHRAIVGAAARFRAAGVAVPPVARWAGPLGRDEVLLWPPDARDAALLGRLPSPRFAFVSGFGIDPEVVARVGAEVGIPLSNQSSFPELVAYLEGTGAKEVAVHRGFADECAEALRARGFDAYALGPPRQLDLFRG